MPSKISGMHFAQYITKQLPVFPPYIYNTKLSEEIRIRVIRLVYTSVDMKHFAHDFGFGMNLKPFIWDSNERDIIKAELDAIFAFMYGYNRKELEYILSTFSRLRINELKEFGEFKTKKLVLEAYDKFNSDPELGPLFRLEGVDLEKLKSE